MDYFVDSISMELYNAIVDITGDELESNQYDAISSVIDVCCSIIWRYGQHKNNELIDQIRNLKKEMEKEVEK